ncbi:hypothetical protein BGZ82_008308 [Podila clonocystis]|nr:hypothetical protein BGZ82_008308 [Podila clonocystis]
MGLNHSPEHFGSSFGQLSSESERSSDSLNTKALAGLSTRQLGSMGDDIEIDEEDKDLERPHSKIMSNTPHARRPLHDSQEDIDIVGVSDEEMEPLKAQTSLADQGPLIKSGLDSRRTPYLSPPEGKNRILDEPNTYNADMDLILGMASDMDLVMPQFDDEYLDDLKNGSNLAVQSRRVPSVSALSPATSHSSLTTITCISSLHSPPSRSMTPGISVESAPRQESPPTSPATIEARKRSDLFSVKGQMPMMGNMSSPNSTENAQPEKDLSTIHRDIDNLKRHRDSLQNSTDMNASSSKGLPTPSSSSSSSSSSNTHSRVPSSDKRSNPQAPLYFKPTHHTQPSGDHSHQNVMIIQSNQWTFDNAQSRPGLVGGPPQQPPTHAIRGNDGNHIFSVRESSPPSPPPVLDKSTIMTTNNISLATANMNILTPQEVQEDYYVKRNIQRMYQRNRRRSSTSAASAASAAAVAAAATVAIPPFRPFGANVPHGPPLNSTIPLPLRRESISPDGPHPLDNFAAPGMMLPLMGVNSLPASYYIPPSAFRTEAAVAAEKEAERKRCEEEELKDSFLVFPSPTLS